MKNLFCFSLLFYVCTASCLSQNLAGSIFSINQMPASGILLDTSWVFHAGDNLDWAKPDFDDHTWQSIDPTRDIHDLPALQKAKIGWFRIHIALDSTINKPLALEIQQSGASEIYVNGRLLQRFGVLSADPAKIIAYDPLWKPVTLPLSRDKRQVIAVRYALQPAILYTTLFETYNPALSLRIKETDEAMHYYTLLAVKHVAFTIFIFAVCVMLCILHLAFYRVYPVQKANLYFGLFALCYLIGSITQLYFYLFNHHVSTKFYIGNFVFAMFMLGEFLTLTSIYYFLQVKKDNLYRFLFGFAVVAIILNAGFYEWGWKVGGSSFLILLHISKIRVPFIALGKRIRGAKIIAIGAVCSALFFITFAFQGTFYNNNFQESLPVFRILLYLSYQLSIPVALSIYLGLDFAYINRTLSQKLSEVSELSEKTINQEKEKQEILSSQKETLEKQVAERTAALKESLQELKAAQSQLIQSEKMASLGELTAGIAHEIQNPLNFVNNFSEINQELFDELEQEINNGDLEEARAIVQDLKENEQKIHHHGKRADSIVKGMLQHSRSSTGEKQLTDINALADEYLRLAYHGLRAKQKDFNADFKLEADLTLSKLEVVPQEIGRVLLNLFNNAFYAVQQKKQQLNGQYQPQVTVTTQAIGNKIEIRVKDNGTGIPESVKGKIFQPFFTTKPTGEGTGLGLSLSYDIITKGHGGSLQVESKAGEYTVIIVSLPI
jgi:signal transduction histidine kinase